jgi:tRNA dimethylallyltransferase
VSTPLPPCVCLTAPTACGKTELALQLAQSLPLEIVSMDSAMVYRGMDIGTAKPEAAVRKAIPHHLIDIADPADAYSARTLPRRCGRRDRRDHGPRQAATAGRGTLLYLRALRQGLSILPQANPAVRHALDLEAAELGWAALHRRLQEIDPSSAARIAPTDRQRIQRALEVYLLTGASLSSLHERARPEPQPSVVTLALVPAQRGQLSARIESRFDAMVAAGFVAEVEGLMARADLQRDTPSMRAVGYRQIWGYLADQYDWSTARDKAIVATRQLAKRQMTWLRSESKNIEVFDPFSPRLAEKLLQRIRSEVARGREAAWLC